MPTTPPTGVLGVNPRRRSRQTEPMEAAAADRLEGLATSFARAGDVVAHDYVVGGSRVSLRFASEALRERLPPPPPPHPPPPRPARARPPARPRLPPPA